MIGWFVSLNGITFQNPDRFFNWRVWVLFSLLAIVVWEWNKRKKVLSHPWFENHRSTSMFPTTFQRLRWWLFWYIAAFLLVLAYASPERVEKTWEPIYEGVRITFKLDISLSTEMEEGVSPTHLEASKELIREIQVMLERDKELKGVYQFALIPFAGAALPYYLPFTTSRERFSTQLDSLDSDAVRKKGTSLWAALLAYDELLLSYPPSKEATMDLGILISSAEKEELGKERAHLSKFVDEIRETYRVARFLPSGQRVISRAEEPQRNVVIFSVGTGGVEVDSSGNRLTRQIPLMRRDKAGNPMGYYREKEGDLKSPILKSTFDEEILREIAVRGGGKYYHISDRGVFLQEFKGFILKHRKEVGRKPHNNYESARSWFVFPAFLIFYFLFGYGGWTLRILRRILLIGRTPPKRTFM